MDNKLIRTIEAIKDDRKGSKAFNLPGSALMFTMFILSGMLIVAMSGAYIILTGIIAGGVQSQSTRAYFAAEAGAERLLYDFRVQSIGLDDLFTDRVDLPGGTYYKIYHTQDPDNPLIVNNYTSVGTFNNISRSVEISF